MQYEMMHQRPPIVASRKFVYGDIYMHSTHVNRHDQQASPSWPLSLEEHCILRAVHAADAADIFVLNMRLFRSEMHQPILFGGSLLHSSCVYSLSKSARHLRTSSGVKTDLSCSSSDEDDDGNISSPLPPQPPPPCIDLRESPAAGSKPITFLVLCGASGTTSAGTTHTPKPLSLQKRCRSCTSRKVGRVRMVWGQMKRNNRRRGAGCDAQQTM